MSAKTRAIELRKEGYSYNYIARETGLSISTLSYHLSKIPYTPNQETVATIGRALAASSLAKSRAKQATLESAKRQASKDIGTLTSRDLFMLGLGLYIGEGSKTHDIVRLVNTDYRVISLYIKWLKEFGVDDSNIVIRLHLYPDSDIEKAEKFWIKMIGLQKSQFQKPSIDRRVGKDRKRSGTHLNGTAHVSVRSNGNKKLGVFLSRRISACMEEVLEYRPKNMRG